MTQKKTSVTDKAISVDNDVDERMVPAKHKGSGIYGEHMARYGVAVELVKRKDVLDIASGSGYGSYMLASTARSVKGVDVSESAIVYSRKKYKRENLEFKQSDGKDIPYDANTFDIVVSFETIEHIEDYNHFMKEVKRVLRKDGLLVLSTPNELEFAEGNHFHLHEFKQNELMQLVKKYYKNIKPYFQSTWTGNLIGTEAEMTSEWTRKIIVDQLHPITPNKFLYFYFLCSDREITESIETRYTISQHSSDRAAHEKNTLTNNHIQNLEDLTRGLTIENKKLHDAYAALDAKYSKISTRLSIPYTETLKRMMKRLLKR